MFKRYSSIEQLSSFNLSKIQTSELTNVEWSLSEKLDGANFSFIVEDIENPVVEIGKRSSKCDGKFFNSQLILDQLENNIKALANLLSEFNDKFQDFSTIGFQLYGEIYGDGVQKRINYGDSKYFHCFDLFVTSTSEAETRFVNVTELEFLANVCNIPMVKTKNFINFSNVMEFIKENNVDEVHSAHSKADSPQNIEGYVIKPVKTERLGQKRAIFKIKSQKFKEKEHKGSKVKEIKEVPKHILALIAKIDDYSNENRFLSAMSKIGEFEMKLFGEFLKEISVDIRIDFLEDHGEEYNSLEKSEQKLINKSISSKVSQLIKEQIKI